MLGYVRNKFNAAMGELASYSGSERLFIFCAMICGFLICSEYSIVRPVANSLFIQTYSAKLFPHAWLAAVPLNILVVSLYNFLLPRWGCSRLFAASILLVMGGNLAFALFYAKLPALSFILYIWKEVYVMLMFQQLWSVIHSNVELKKAKYLYGIFFGMGGLGSLLGSSLPSFFAVSLGSENILFFAMPIYFSLIFFYHKMVKYSGSTPDIQKVRSWESFTHGCKLIGQSRFLMYALLIVVIMQLSAALVDFQFSDYLGRIFSDKDMRTEYTARVLGLVQAVNLVLQFIGSFLIMRFLGVKNSHFFIPTVLAINAIGYIIFPAFALLTFSFVAIKACDFSIFNITKEMLYVPLKSDEKFRAKAVIDVFAYRSSKALASFLILGLQFFLTDLQPVLTWTCLSISLLWIGTVFWGLRDYHVSHPT